MKKKLNKWPLVDTKSKFLVDPLLYIAKYMQKNLSSIWKAIMNRQYRGLLYKYTQKQISPIRSLEVVLEKCFYFYMKLNFL